MDSATEDLRDLNLGSGNDDTKEGVGTEDLNTNNDEDTEEDEDDEEADDRVLLAFVNDEDPHGGPEELLMRRHRRFPRTDKAGGFPAWLDPVDLPAGEIRLCGFCGEPLRFALQVYAPLPVVRDNGDVDDDAAYHRALFVFMCPAMMCLLHDQTKQLAEVAGDGGWRRRSVRVFRCQLPRDNAFYRYDCDDDNARDNGEARFAAGVEAAPLCDWCGTWRAEAACAACDTAAAATRMFCSEKHLEGHVRSGGCGGDERAPSAASAAWPEYAMVCEEEDTSSTAAQEHHVGGDGDNQVNADDGNGEDNAAAADDDEAAVDDAMVGAFEAAAAADEDSVRWASFLARVSPEQNQVLRYCAGGRPLWAAASGSLPSAGAPACGRCGGARRHEMQLMPQLLDYFRVEARDPDPLDWATVAVYTCARSCGGDGGGAGGYVEEFAWVQRLPCHDSHGRPSDCR